MCQCANAAKMGLSKRKRVGCVLIFALCSDCRYGILDQVNASLKLRICLILPVLVLLAAASVTASAPIEAKQYLAVREKLATRLSIATLKSDPGSYIGKVFEIRGMMTGICGRSGKSCSIIVTNTAESTSYTVTTDTPPTETPGIMLACLVKIGPKSTVSLCDLELVASTFLVDLERLEAQTRPAATGQAPTKKIEPSRAATQRGSAARYLSAEDIVLAYKRAIKRFNSKLSDKQADTIARSILGFSYRYNVDPRLVCAVILAESHFRIGATSKAGAQGLGQLMPTTAAGLGVDNAYDPVQNIYGSVRYVRSMLDRMCGNGKKWEELTWYDLALALAAYNAGPNAVKRHGGIPPYKETQNYVKRVTSIYKQLCGIK